jgi:hypothetical protein
MIHKPLELPPAVARAFVKDMKAFFAEENRYKQDEIALRQLHALKEHQGPREKPLRLSDVKSLFIQMRDQTTGTMRSIPGMDSPSSERSAFSFSAFGSFALLAQL